MKRSERIVQEKDVDWIEWSPREPYGLRIKRLGQEAGGERLGCSLYEVSPGKRPFPYHWHAANEEAHYVVEGEGTLRLAGNEVPIAAGDYVVLQTGEAGAHQIVNTSEKPLRFLAFSTMIQPEVAGYPDSGKVLALAGQPPGGDMKKMTVMSWFPEDQSVEYYDGEGEER